MLTRAGTIYLQHGETDMNLLGRIGGDGHLSERGRQVITLYWLTNSILFVIHVECVNYKRFNGHIFYSTSH